MFVVVDVCVCAMLVCVRVWLLFVVCMCGAWWRLVVLCFDMFALVWCAVCLYCVGVVGVVCWFVLICGV